MYDDKEVGRVGRAILEVVKKLYYHRMIDTLSGNVSAKLSDGSILITPGGASKKEDILSGNKIDLAVGALSLITTDGKVICGDSEPSSEWRMHAATYKAIPEARSLVHPHPICTLSLFDSFVENSFEGEKRLESGLLGLNKALSNMEEPEYYVGKVGAVCRLKNGSEELAESVAAEFGKGCTVVVLEAHGVAAIGPTLYKALGRAEALEIAAEKFMRSLGTRNALRSGNALQDNSFIE